VSPGPSVVAVPDLLNYLAIFVGQRRENVGSGVKSRPKRALVTASDLDQILLNKSGSNRVGPRRDYCKR
jgi:hypothetical protein